MASRIRSASERSKRGARARAVVREGRVGSPALLCLPTREVGAERVVAVPPSAVIGTISLTEGVVKPRERGLNAKEVEEALVKLHLGTRPLLRAGPRHGPPAARHAGAGALAWGPRVLGARGGARGSGAHRRSEVGDTPAGIVASARSRTPLASKPVG